MPFHHRSFGKLFQYYSLSWQNSLIIYISLFCHKMLSCLVCKIQSKSIIPIRIFIRAPHFYKSVAIKQAYSLSLGIGKLLISYKNLYAGDSWNLKKSSCHTCAHQNLPGSGNITVISIKLQFQKGFI